MRKLLRTLVMAATIINLGACEAGSGGASKTPASVDGASTGGVALPGTNTGGGGTSAGNPPTSPTPPTGNTGNGGGEPPAPTPIDPAAPLSPPSPPPPTTSAHESMCGLYVLSYNGNTNNMRDYDFVSGYTLRLHWNEVQLGAQQYDFAEIDEALAKVEQLGQHLVLELFVTSVPQYILDQLNQTWVTQQGYTTGLPWDATLMSQWQSFIQVLSLHQVTYQGQLIPLAQHPLLIGINTPIVGLQSIRDQSGQLVLHPQYTRDAFISAVMMSVHTVYDAFPQANTFLGYFGMNDGVLPNLGEDILSDLSAEFITGKSPVRFGLFQELLSDSSPDPNNFGAVLQQMSATTYIVFQALTPWVQPFAGMENKVTSGDPGTGIALGHLHYSARYFELYVEDIDSAQFWGDFSSWDATLCN